MYGQRCSTPKKLTLKFVIAILAAVFVSGIAYGSWKLLSKSRPASSFSEGLTTVSTTSESIVRAEIESPIAGWKVYRNEKYGYRIKYPEEWVYKEFGRMDKRIVDYVAFSPRELERDSGNLRIFVLEESLVRQRERLPHSIGFAKEELVDLGGVSSIKISGLAGYPIQKPVVHILVPKSSTLTYEVSYTEEMGTEIIQDIERMISTFGFISE